jgi:DNA-binding response OmpR family regulator
VAASLLAHLSGVDGEDRLRRHLAGAPWLAPAVASFLRGNDTQGAIQPPGLDSLRTAVVLSARACAEEKPTLVILEDLQNGGLDGAELLADLAAAVSGTRLMVVGTTSGPLPPRALARLERSPGFDRLSLQPLGTASVDALLADALGASVPGGLAGEIAAATSGSPLFALEILRDLQRSGDLARGIDGRWTRRDQERPLPLPASVKGMVEARLADLEEEDRDLLDVAACVGVEFDPVRAGAVLGRGPIPTLRRLARLEERHRLVRAAGDHYFFESPRVREVILDRLSTPLRLQYEAALARGSALHPSRPASPVQPEDVGQDRPFRVLVADDDEIVRGLLLSHVEALGLEAIPADNGLSALAQMRRDAPDLLLLDMKMPGLSGSEVLQRVKGDPRLKEIPVIVITGVDDVAAAADCLKGGAIDYIVKPFNSTLLRARIGATVDRGLLRRKEQDYQRRIEEYSLSLEERMGASTREAEASLRLWKRTQRIRSLVLRLIAEDVGGPEMDRSAERVLLLVEDALALTRWTDGDALPPMVPVALGEILARAQPRLPKAMRQRIPDAGTLGALEVTCDPLLAPLAFAALLETALAIGGEAAVPRLTGSTTSSGATVDFHLPAVRPDAARLRDFVLRLTLQERESPLGGVTAPALAARLLDLWGGRVSVHETESEFLLQAHLPPRSP